MLILELLLTPTGYFLSPRSHVYHVVNNSGKYRVILETTLKFSERRYVNKSARCSHDAVGSSVEMYVIRLVTHVLMLH